MDAPLRVLAMIAAPSDAPSFDAAGCRRSLEEALRPACAQGIASLEFLAEPTENALRKRLAQAPVHAFHFIGHGRSQQSAQYGTLVFQDSSGRARGLNAPYLATLLKSQPQLRVVLLQACGAGDDPLGQVASALAQQLAVVSGAFGDAASEFMRHFYAALATGDAAGAAFAAAQQALVVAGHACARAAFHLRGRAAAVVGETKSESHEPAPIAASPPARTIAPAVADVVRNAEADAAAQEIRRKRAAGAFDVFLCHNWADKTAVKSIAADLKARGILPWLDEWELPPGQPWQPLLEQQIGSIRSAAVFVGAAGMGPWQEQELYSLLREFASRRSPVIPVCLGDAPDKPELPIFLRAMTWVDFRLHDPDPMERLVWGITGRRADE